MLFLNQFLVFFSHKELLHMLQIRHGFRLKGSIALDIDIIELVIDDENEMTQILNPQPRLSQMSDDTHNIEDPFHLNV